MRKCAHSHCRNHAARNRRECWKHIKARWRKRKPMLAAFCSLRDRAIRRGIKFSLDYATFTRFAEACDYIGNTGLFKKCITVDRIDNRLGYEPDNIQPLTREENSRKRCKQDEIRMRCGFSWRTAA